MITLYPYEKLGHVDHGWLDARHHFSFARYWNPARTHFGALRVINDDRITAGTGFGTHPHDNMEIITYVREGAITHADSMGNKGRTSAGDVQVMSAGTGIRHSEHNQEKVDTKLYQIWIEPARLNVAPRWETRAFPKNLIREGALSILASGRDADIAAGALPIHQDAALYGGRLQAGASLTQSIKHNAYILASSGHFRVNDVTMRQGDGAEATGLNELVIEALEDSELLVIDVPDSIANAA